MRVQVLLCDGREQQDAARVGAAREDAELRFGRRGDEDALCDGLGRGLATALTVLVGLPGSAALVKRKNAKGVHPVAVAAAAGHVEVMDVLLGAGGSLAERDANGASPLALAAFCGQAAMLRSLLSKRADIESVDAAGATPLWLGASAGHTEVVSILLDAGARAGVLSGGKTALQAATTNGHAAIKSLLEALPMERLMLTSADDDDAADDEAGSVAPQGEEEGAVAGVPSDGAGDDDGDPRLMSFTHTGAAGSSAAPPRVRSTAVDEPLEGVALEEQGSDSEDEERPQLTIN